MPIDRGGHGAAFRQLECIGVAACFTGLEVLEITVRELDAMCVVAEKIALDQHVGGDVGDLSMCTGLLEEGRQELMDVFRGVGGHGVLGDWGAPR